MRAWIELILLRAITNADTCEQDDEASEFIKGSTHY
jgi:hypothetical protein